MVRKQGAKQSPITGRHMSIEEMDEGELERSVGIGPTNPELQRVPESHLREGSLSFIERQGQEESNDSDDGDGRVTIYNSEDDEEGVGQEAGTLPFDPAILSQSPTAQYEFGLDAKKPADKTHDLELLTGFYPRQPIKDEAVAEDLRSLTDAVLETLSEKGTAFRVDKGERYIEGYARIGITDEDNTFYVTLGLGYTHYGLGNVLIRTRFISATNSEVAGFLTYIGEGDIPGITQTTEEKGDKYSHLTTISVGNDNQEAPLRLTDDAKKQATTFVESCYKIAQQFFKPIEGAKPDKKVFLSD